MLSNAIRGHTAEFGIISAKGRNGTAELLEIIAKAEATPPHRVFSTAPNLSVADAIRTQHERQQQIDNRTLAEHSIRSQNVSKNYKTYPKNIMDIGIGA
jgi:hypothetical protein